MCDCQKSKSNEAYTTSTSGIIIESVDESGCAYSKVQTNNWLQRTHCVKNTGAYSSLGLTVDRINIYLNVLLSVQAFDGTPCEFQSELEEIEAFIILLNGKNICI